MKHKEIVEKMSLEQKAAFVSGYDYWHLEEAPELGLPKIMITDGPHGLRKANPDKKSSTGGIGLGNSVPATCFPPAATSSCSWDPELLEQEGEAMGEECLKEKVSTILGPGTNIKRAPVGGRNFEYYSEDPYVSGVMAASVTRGVQSHPGLGVTIKHFCCNNQEDKRETVSENVPERALREIYLRGFEIAVRKSKPWAVMTSYNLVNGVHTFASNDLCTKALRNEWEYQGLVMTDWTASEKNPGEHTSCILAGNDLIMPGHPGAKKELTAALKSGQIKRSELEVAAANVLNVIFSSNVWSINE